MKNSKNQIGRRDFLKTVGLATPFFLAGSAMAAGEETNSLSDKNSVSRTKEMPADLVIIGGGMGGCSAALAAARNGLNVILTEETDWIGGQITQQAVPPDENKWVETFGGTRSYQKFRTGIRDFYRRNYPLTEKSLAEKYFNPGNCWVSRIGCEPRVASGGALRNARAVSRQWAVANFVESQGRQRCDRPRPGRSRECSGFGFWSRNRFACAVFRRCDGAGRLAAADQNGICDRSRIAQTKRRARC